MWFRSETMTEVTISSGPGGRMMSHRNTRGSHMIQEALVADVLKYDCIILIGPHCAGRVRHERFPPSGLIIRGTTEYWGV